MSTVVASQTGFWARHFRHQARETNQPGNRQLDFSHAAVAMQTYAFVLEAAGQVGGKHVLDCGFGTGELARMFDLLGASVDAFDLVSERVPRLRQETPSVYWHRANLAEWKLPDNREAYDLIVACEVLQYVDFDRVTANLLDGLAAGGRLIVMIPNADCAIVQRVSARFDNQYRGISATGLPARLAAFNPGYHIAYRGIQFQEDQTLVPYASESWTILNSREPMPVASACSDPTDVPPHRLQIVLSKSANSNDCPSADGHSD